MKLAVIGGAGLVGSSSAFVAGSMNFLSEIKLVDLKKNVVASHAMDMGQALSGFSKTKVTAADYKDIGDCDIILFTASLPERKVSSRNEYMQGNLSLVLDACKEIKQYCNNKIMLCCTNPTDVFNYAMYKILGWDKNRFLGFSLNDTIRMKWSLQQTLNLDYDKIDTICLGEHGEGQVPLYEQTTYEGKPLNLSQEQIATAKKLIMDWFIQWQELDSGRTTGWTSAVSLTNIIRSIAQPDGKPIPCSAILSGEYGENNVSIGVPCVLGPNGVEKIVTLDLTAGQKERFQASAAKIRDLSASIGY